MRRLVTNGSWLAALLALAIVPSTSVAQVSVPSPKGAADLVYEELRNQASVIAHCPLPGIRGEEVSYRLGVRFTILPNGEVSELLINSDEGGLSDTYCVEENLKRALFIPDIHNRVTEVEHTLILKKGRGGQSASIPRNELTAVRAGLVSSVEKPAVFQENFPRLMACYQQEWVQNPKLSTTLHIQFTINAEGDVTSAAPALEGASPDLITCLTQQITTFRFPPPLDGTFANAVHDIELKLDGDFSVIGQDIPIFSQGNQISEKVIEIPYSDLRVREGVMPDHPQDVKALGWETMRCKARVFITADGTPYAMRYESCDAILQPAVTKALAQWRWKAPDLGGAERAQFLLSMKFQAEPVKYFGAHPTYDLPAAGPLSVLSTDHQAIDAIHVPWVDVAEQNIEISYPKLARVSMTAKAPPRYECNLKVYIDPNGSPYLIDGRSCINPFRTAVVHAVQDWRFQPVTRHDKATPAAFDLKVLFLRKSGDPYVEVFDPYAEEAR